MATQTVVNGVDTSRLMSYLKSVKQNPESGIYKFRAMNRWDDGGHCYSTIQDFEVGGHEDTSRPKPFVLEGGEPDILLGKDQGPNATEAVLHALATCLNTTFIYHAAAKGVKIDELELELVGDLDIRGFLGITDEVRNGFNNIQVTFRVKTDANEEQIRELCELAQRRSPVFDIITHGVPVNAKAEKMQGVEEPVSVGV